MIQKAVDMLLSEITIGENKADAKLPFILCIINKAYILF